MTADSEYRVHFVKQENGPQRRIRHGAVTLRAVIEKRTPNGCVLDKSGSAPLTWTCSNTMS